MKMNLRWFTIAIPKKKLVTFLVFTLSQLAIAQYEHGKGDGMSLENGEPVTGRSAGLIFKTSK
jgi:hypothetical protein